ncbi:MAG: response regulator [Deferrisomatales bacterium]
MRSSPSQAPRLYVAVCENLRSEAQAVLGTAGVEVVLLSYPADCGHGLSAVNSLSEQIRRAAGDGSDIHVFGGACLAQLRPPPAGLPDCHIHFVEDCFRLVAGERLVASLCSEGAYLITPGWLAKWQERLHEWGFDQETGRDFFRECTSKLVLLDTGICRTSDESLRSLSEYLGIPAEVVPVGLDSFRRFLDATLSRWRVETRARASQEAIGQARQRSADLAMVVEMAGEIAAFRSEEAIIERLLEIAQSLFAPSSLRYWTVSDGAVLRARQLPEGQELPPSEPPVSGSAWAVSDDGTGLSVTVSHGDGVVGILEMLGLCFPERALQYASAARILADVCGLAVANARAFLDLQGKKDDLEKNQERLREEIEHRKLLEQALLTAKDAAEAANRAKSDFLARMSHEIRTPMNGIMGMTELALMEDHLPQRVRDYLGLAKQSAKGLLEIINDILDVARIEAGRVELDEKPFDLLASVRNLLASLRIAAERKGLRLTYRLASALPGLVLGDEGRLRQVLTNLVGNAIKFTERGEVAVTVGFADGLAGSELPVPSSQTRNLEPETGNARDRVRLLFSVRDTGIGIPSENLLTIFDSFSAATRSTHVKYGGTGLGLSIAKQLVELMGGRVWAESPAPAPSGRPRDFCRPGGPNAAEPQGGGESGPSPGGHEPGRGTLFRFTAEFALLDVEEAEPSVASRPPVPGGGLRVLVAEDNPLNQIFARELLTRLGHEVTVASDGEEALRALSRERFDAVLMDIQMPCLDGDEATRRIRAGKVEGCPRDMPIVALTAHAVHGDRDRFLDAGMDDYLSKPFDPEAMEDVLRQVVERRRKRGGPSGIKNAT